MTDGAMAHISGGPICFVPMLVSKREAGVIFGIFSHFGVFYRPFYKPLGPGPKAFRIGD